MIILDDIYCAQMVKLVDTLALGASTARYESSSLSLGIICQHLVLIYFFDNHPPLLDLMKKE